MIIKHLSFLSKSRIFLYFLLFFLAGVLVASVLLLPYKEGNALKFVSGFSFVIGILSLALFWKREGRFMVGFFLLFFSFGIFWYQFDASKNLLKGDDLSAILSQREVVGIIVDEPDFKEDKASYILMANDRSRRKILVQTLRYPEYEYGDEVVIEGKIKEPENFSDDFDWRAHLAKDDIYLIAQNPKINLVSKNKGSQVYRYLYKFKNNLENSFKDILPEPQASLLSGVTLGSRSSLPKDVLDDFQKTGTMHIVALSGYNIAVIAWFVMMILGHFMVSRNISFWVALSVLVIFVLMTGASASVVRAAVMGALILIARQRGRMYSAKNALIFAGAVMVFLNPKILRFDVGFQLSFLATLGLLVLSPKLEEWLKKMPDIFGVKQALVATLSAQIFVLPLIFYHFGSISWLGPLVNVLILPAVPVAMSLGFGGVFAGLLFAPLAKFFLWPAWLFLSYVLEVTNLFSNLL